MIKSLLVIWNGSALRRWANTLWLLALPVLVFSQNASNDYAEQIKKADSLFDVQKYLDAATVYSFAIGSNTSSVSTNDRYKACVAWTLAGDHESAFYNLDLLCKMGYDDYQTMVINPDFDVLHDDKRWARVLKNIWANKEKTEPRLNKQLVKRLDSMYVDDQQYRRKMEKDMRKYGWESKEVKADIEVFHKKDSINAIRLAAILDGYGWLGPEVIGKRGASTLFYVLQHAELPLQEKYLPMVRRAVKEKKIKGSFLVMLEDRVALRQGRKQLYGSQIAMDNETKAFYVSDLEDPDNVDKRRSALGLEPMAEYVRYWNIKWDVEEYKKEMKQRIDKESKMRHN